MTKSFTQSFKKDVLGKRRVVIGDVTISSYTASGEVVVPGDFGLKTLESVHAHGLTDGGFSVRYDDTTATLKLRAYRGGGFGGPVTDSFPDVTQAALPVANSSTTNQAASPTGGANLLALTAATLTTAIAVSTNPDIARSVVVVIKNNDVGSQTWSASNCTVTGTDQFGTAITEVTAMDTTAIVAANFRVYQGTKIFKTVSQIQFSVAGPVNAQVSLGTGTRVGLLHKIGATTDVKTVSKLNIKQVVTTDYTVDTTYHSIVGVTGGAMAIATNDDFLIEYESAPNLADQEAASTTNVGVFRVTAFGQ